MSETRDNEKRRTIMRAAERLFMSRRFNEITTDDIAREAAVGKGTIYRYFADKDDLFFQTAISGFDSLCELVGRCAASGDVRPDLVEACGAISDFFGRRRQMLSMMQAEESRAMFPRGRRCQEWRDRRRQLCEALGGVIERGREQGVVHSPLPSHVLASYLFGLLRTRARDLVDEPEDQRSNEAVVRLFLFGAADCQPAAPATATTTTASGARAGRRRR